MTELTTLELIKEIYHYFNVRGLLDKSEKERIDTSIKRSGKKIGKKIDDFIETIFESDIKEIIKDKKYRKKMRKNLKKALEIYNVIPSCYKLKSFVPLYMALISFIGTVVYLVDTRDTDVEILKFIPYKSFDEKDKNSTIKSIFDWFKNRVGEKKIWSNIDSGTLAGWCNYEEPEIITNQSIIKLKKRIKDDYEEISEKNIELLGVLLFFGRIIWSCYLEVKEKMPFIEELGYVAFCALNSKDEKGKKNWFETLNFEKIIEKNCFYKEERIVEHIRDQNKFEKLVEEIYNSSEKYKKLEEEWINIKKMSYSNLKNWFEKENLEKIRSGLEGRMYTIFFNYIYIRASEEKDEKMLNKLKKELEYKFLILVDKGLSLKELKEMLDEIMEKKNMTREILKSTIHGKIEGIIGEEEIINWGSKNLKINYDDLENKI